MITIDPPSSPPTPALALSKPSLTRFLARARALVPFAAPVDVLLTTDAEIRRLNRTFRRKNKATDILSFPAEPVPGLPAEHQYGGDLAISLETAARQAEQCGHPLATEIRVLILHGLLHLAGFDHESDNGQMAERERALRTALRLPGGLIERVTGDVPRRVTHATPPRQRRARV